MAEKEPVIVIKKITIAAAGGHGGSWKVAFADFMTAMMAFFLLMWLLGQSDQVKKNVSDYFSTPSIIEYNFSNYGVELTLEKLFLDLINEPLKAFQQFVQPADYTPNFLSLGTKNIVMAELADQLGDMASDVSVNSDEIVFEIPEKYLFVSGTAQPANNFVDVMERLIKVTAGLQDAEIRIDSRVYEQTVRNVDPQWAKKIAEMRLDMVVAKVQSTLEHESVDVLGKAEAKKGERRREDGRPTEGFIRINIKQKDKTSDGQETRKIGEMFGSGDESTTVYDSFVKQLADRKPQGKKRQNR